MSEDHTDLVAFSPGHFLVGGPLLSVTEPEMAAAKGPASAILLALERRELKGAP